MEEVAVRAELKKFILEELLRDPDYMLGDDEPIVSSGMVDSFSIAEIGIFIELSLGVSIPDPEMTVEKMDTLNLMTARVMQG